jgi:predicted transcriptional regulator
MTSIILPIQQNPFDRIFNYSKHYEFRKRLPLDTTEIYLYLSKTGIMGKLIISKVMQMDVKDLINIANLTESNSGLKLSSYFKDGAGSVAVISNRYLFKYPILMSFTPQSYVYLDRYEELKKQLEQYDLSGAYNNN